MGIIKKTAWMATGSLLLLVALGIADPNSNRLMPSLFSNLSVGDLPKGTIDEEAVRRAIVQFNSDLAQAYLQLDPASIIAGPMADDLKRNFAKEIAFLQQDGRALEVLVQDIRVERVSRLPDLTLRVDTVESVRVRYLNPADRSEIAADPPARYAINYTLEQSAGGWKVSGWETMKVGGRHE